MSAPKTYVIEKEKEEPKALGQFCNNCHYRRSTRCHRDPPDTDMDLVRMWKKIPETWAYWPNISVDEWCGEWQLESPDGSTGKCSNCFYCRVSECKIKRPKFLPLLSEKWGLSFNTGYWPGVHKDGWCGYFTAVPPSTLRDE